MPTEGWTEFVDDAKRYGNFIMGRETYELVMKLYPDHNFDDVDVSYKIIVSTNANFTASDRYIAVRSPEEAKTFLTERNAKVGLLVGGGKLNSGFYERGLVDEVWIIINPYILGKGRPFISSADLDVEPHLTDIVRLNKDRVQLKRAVAK